LEVFLIYALLAGGTFALLFSLRDQPHSLVLACAIGAVFVWNANYSDQKTPRNKVLRKKKKSLNFHRFFFSISPLLPFPSQDHETLPKASIESFSKKSEKYENREGVCRFF
jgi:hypothetical protein